MPLIVIFVGLLVALIGLSSAFLGAYMVNGEAHHNLDEGVPALVIGAAGVIAGFLLILWGARKLRRRTHGRPRNHEKPGAEESGAP